MANFYVRQVQSSIRDGVSESAKIAPLSLTAENFSVNLVASPRGTANFYVRQVQSSIRGDVSESAKIAPLSLTAENFSVNLLASPQETKTEYMLTLLLIDKLQQKMPRTGDGEILLIGVMLMSAFDSRQTEKSALLFDAVKFAARVQGKSDFARTAEEFLSPYLSSADGRKILSCLIGADNDFHALLIEADALASGTNSRKLAGHGGRKLENVFNIFGDGGTQTYFEPQLFTGDVPVMPTTDSSKENFDDKCAEIFADLKRCLETISLTDCAVNDLLQVLERCLSFIPAGTEQDELADISLYDHAKLTAAYAVCLQKYLAERNVDDFTELENLRGDEIFLLVTGDVSGIQQFIYTIPSKGALKSLRGRSFYLELLLEHVADEILTAAGISRSALLYTGGGHFYLLLPNTAEVNDLLKTFADKINDWFLAHFDSRLYLALAWTPCTALEFVGQTGEPFRRVGEKLSKAKLCRYNESQLKALFAPDSFVNKTRDGYRECGICHTSAKELEYYNDTDETLACQSCRALFLFGSRMLKCDGFIVAKKFFGYLDDALPLPSLTDELFLFPSADDKKIPSNAVVRRYEKKRDDRLMTGKIGLWLADYVTRNSSGDVLDFEELATLSGGDDSGIKRLGVMRADVDNLGAAFMCGFRNEYSTLTRSATLSRQLAYFFKHVMNFLCAGTSEQFSLFGEKKSPRNVHVVYSGGDDLFMVGAWDDLIELAVDVRKAFDKFTNGKLTFSGGIGFFKPKLPVNELARKTGELEDTAKDNPGKDSVALFGAPTLIKSGYQQPEKPQYYSWRDFVENVCGDKLGYLVDNFKFDALRKLESTSEDKRLAVGTSGLYRILTFLADTDERRKSVNLARFAYMLALLNPGENKPTYKTYENVREQLYFFYKSAQHRKELRTALELVLYSLRDK